MTTSIKISKETKRKLEVIKRPDETFDELLSRLIIERTEDDVEALAGFADNDIEQHMDDERTAFSDSLNDRTDRTHTRLDQS
ncbi:DUF7557 family protein [Halorubrum vacuolatum]|uniref:Uncharacterized ACR, COG1753 n=1 Tax=Halorubrum vacuolatum TaxID=63740 RepID=A0A238XDF8_HALVU|nr:antitoxin VapB family protein [Halorubrum vacuolatum]SNR56712.1 Uncharacterized ACR, COG1753 [Halorubrum vacuolatum]